MDLVTKIGQCMVGGFAGPYISPEFKRLVEEYKVGNVILFKRNIVDCEQLKELCGSIQELVQSKTGHSAFIAIDQEGGCVTRLPKEACNVPGQMAIAATGAPANARLAARIAARELKAAGINFNLAPVLDVNSNERNPVIGVRSYGDAAAEVGRYGCEAVAGYEEEKILCAAKHFPGHGDTETDSHLGLPVIDKTLEELERVELLPFRMAVEAGVPAVMTSHILFPKLEPDRVPCTMSRRMLTGLLRERLGFAGLIVSDCMEMDAIAAYYGTAAGTVRAIAAGANLVLICHTAERMEEAARSVESAVRSGEIAQEILDRSVEKILACKEKYAEGRKAETFDRKSAQGMAEEMRFRSVVVTQGSVRPLGDRPFFVGCRDFRATMVSDKESGVSFPEYMASKLGGSFLVTGDNPDGEETDRAVKLAKEATGIVVCTYNGHMYEGQRKLVHALSETGVPVTAVALRNPYDLAHLPGNVTGIAAWEYTEEIFAVLASILKGERKALGRLPVRFT